MAPTGSAAQAPTPGARRTGVLVVLLGGALYASAGLFTRSLPYDAWTVLAWRSLFGALYMVGLVVLENRRLRLTDFAVGGPHLVLVPFTALGTICYILALKLTSVADVMIVYATVPFVTACVAWIWTRAMPQRRTLAASAFALLGVAVMIGGGGPPSGARLLGALLTLVMNVSFACTLVLVGGRPKISMTPSNAAGILLASLIGFALAPDASLSPAAFGVAAAFGILTIGFAMSLFMVGARLLPAAEVALLGISDTVLGPVLVWLAFGENPGPASILGGVLVISALIWHLWPEVKDLLGVRRTIPSGRI